MKRKIVIFSLIAFSIVLYFQFKNKEENQNIILEENENYNSNLLENIRYVAKDDRGNEYVINAEKGEIDLENSDIIFLENVKSFIKLKNSDRPGSPSILESVPADCKSAANLRVFLCGYF